MTKTFITSSLVIHKWPIKVVIQCIATKVMFDFIRDFLFLARACDISFILL